MRLQPAVLHSRPRLLRFEEQFVKGLLVAVSLHHNSGGVNANKSLEENVNVKRTFLVSSLIALAAACQAQFTAGRLVVSMVGESSSALSNAATAIKLQEYALDGTPGYSVNMPTAISGTHLRITMSGVATSEGGLTRSADGRYLVLQGYDADPGTASIAGTSATAVQRVIGRVDWNGNVDTTTGLGTTAYSGNNIRGSASSDGSQFWAAGTSSSATNGGVWTAPLGGLGATQVSNFVNNTRRVKIFFGQLYMSTASTSGFGSVGIVAVGTGLPLTNDSMAMLISTGSSSSVSSPYDFYFADVNTCYIADDLTIANGGGIQKWVNSGGTWSKVYTLNTGLTAGCRGLTGVTIGGTTTLYATTADAITGTNGNSIVTVTDTGAASAFTVIATADGNTAFRGIDWAPANVATTTTITPTSGVVSPGGTVAGSLSDIGSSNDGYWVLRPGVVFSNAVDPIALTLTGTAPGHTPSILKVVVESRSSSNGTRQVIEAYNYSTNAFDVIDTTTLPFGANPDLVKNLTLPTPANYVSSSNNEVKMRLRYRATTAVFSFPWKPSIDEATWRYTN
jgi:hypothetical protein